MTRDETHSAEPQSAAEQLLEDSWEARERRASRRELAVELTAGVLFLAAAGALLVLSGAPAELRPATAALLIGLYVLVARVEFPVGTGHAVPTQLVLAPMLLLLPAGAVPLAVAIGLLTATAMEWRLGRIPGRRLISTVPDAWHAVGPALVLLAAGPAPAPVVLAAAFAACCAADVVSTLARMALMGCVPTANAFAGMVTTVWAVDACLAPIGFLAGAHGLAAVLIVMPLVGLLNLLARDRRRRIEQAHARLRLVEHERERLQSAVRRLGDAFAAKLELDSLLEIFVHGSVEALDAAGGRLDLLGLPTHVSGSLEGTEHLSVPMRIAAEGTPLSGTLLLARDGRPFDDEERSLVAELAAKAEHAAAEILVHQALREQALTDPLTGLGNRRRLRADLGEVLDREATSALLLFDLDGFKGYNDSFGHVAGDRLLARLGAKLTAAVGGDGETYRLGGDEFCALLELDGVRDLDDLVTRTAGALSEHGDGFVIGASLGVVVLPHEADTTERALRLADERMYASKRSRANGPRDQARDLLLRTMGVKQPALDEHASGVAELAVMVGRRLGLQGEALDEIARAAELHDVGKVGVPDAILTKPAPLDGDEWSLIHQHTVLGERILDAAPALRGVARLVRASHERWDGMGYPDRLAGTAIPLGARIVAVCDAYEAMTADRPYRKALPHRVAREELLTNAGTQFDPAVVRAFLAALDDDTPADDETPAGAAARHIRSLLEPRVPQPSADLAVCSARAHQTPIARNPVTLG
jgi:diguanylate cyclase (GGDEF)-like protein